MAYTGKKPIDVVDVTQSQSLTVTDDLTVDTDTLHVDSTNDRVGIGTSSPTQVFEVNNGSNTAAAIKVTDTSGYTELFFGDSADDDAGYISYRHSTNHMAFGVNAAERMRIDSSGNLLIANTTNNINNGGIMLRTTGDTYYGITSTGNTLHVYDNTNSAYRFYVNGNGGIRNYSANNVNLSDQREKKNITDAASTWTDIKNFSIKEFHYNSEDDADPKKIGVIAQDVQASNVNLVSTFNVDDNTQRLAVKEQQITWMAIKALQEAITKIEALETQNADFETRIAALEAN